MDLVTDPRHDSNHYPEAGDDETFQESWACSWFDPAADCSGWHHFSVKRPLGKVDVKSWVSVRGRLAHSFQTWTLPIPDGDYTDIHMGPVRLRSLQPLVRHQVEIEDTGLAVAIVCSPVAGPHWYSRRSMEQREASHRDHWESYNRFEGVVRLDGEAIPVTGFSFLNRSWGPRSLKGLLTHRIIFACWGEELTLRVFTPTTPKGPDAYGLVVDHGVLSHLTRVELQTVMSTDGANPTGCRAEVWAQSGKGYAFSGRCPPGHAWINTHPGEAMYSHASTVFDLGGRLGGGFLQVNELKRPAPWDLDRLGIQP